MKTPILETYRLILRPFCMEDAKVSYILRAYTNWMQNFGAERFFTRRLMITKADAAGWRVNTAGKIVSVAGKDNAQIALQLLENDGDPLRLHDVQISLREGDKTSSREKMQTGIDGKLSLNFDISPNTKADKLMLIVKDMLKPTARNNKKLIIPVPVNREKNIDLQFMPEGGQLVAGLTSKMGFKAVGENGKGAEVNGEVFDSKGTQVTHFKSAHKGMGSFIITPAIDEKYIAKIKLSDGSSKTFLLPAIKSSGIVLTVNNIPGRDSVLVSVQATKNRVSSTDTLYSLIAVSGGRVCFVSALNFSKSGTVSGKINKNRFPTGVAKFIVFNNQQRPIAERNIFINNGDNLHIVLNPESRHNGANTDVTLAITVTDKEKKPVQGSFSLAVTDDDRIKADSSNVPDIKSYMLLTSELKGNIENPGWYFTGDATEKALALDDLLLTQGWIAYDWNNIFSPVFTPKYRNEKLMEITGVVRRLNKPQPHVKINLLNTRGGIVFRDTVTDANGRFVFNNLPKMDDPAYSLQVKDSKGKIFDAYIEVDEFKPAAVNALPVTNETPWYVNSDSTLFNFNKMNAAIQKEQVKVNFPSGTRTLQEVVITGKKIIKGSRNLNGPGNADQVLDAEDMKKLGKMTLYDLLFKRIKGFTIRSLPMEPQSYFAVYEKQAKLVIDGKDADFFYNPSNADRVAPNEYFNYLKNHINQFSAEDIKGIEIMYNRGLTAKYNSTYDPAAVLRNDVCEECTPPWYAFPAYIEITTWSGNGLFTKPLKGTYLYKPLPISWPKSFYKPKYPSTDTVQLMAPTLFWEPNIVTDQKGKTAVTFTKKASGKVTLILQGADLNGLVGAERKTLK